MNKAIIEIDGFRELQDKIKKLGNDKDKRREILSILRNEAKSTVKAARQFAPVSKKPHVARGTIINPGNLRDSIGTITGRKGQSRLNPTIYVGPRVKGKNKGWYGAMVEEGHNVYTTGFKRKNRSTGSTKRYAGKAIGFVKPRRFMKPAYELTKGKVVSDLEKQTARFIQRRINRLSNKGI